MCISAPTIDSIKGPARSGRESITSSRSPAMSEISKKNPFSRRSFLGTVAAGAAGLVVGCPMGARADSAEPLTTSSSDGEDQNQNQTAASDRFGRMFPRLAPFAPASPGLTQALIELGRPGGILDANDPLDRSRNNCGTVLEDLRRRSSVTSCEPARSEPAREPHRPRRAGGELQQCRECARLEATLNDSGHMCVSWAKEFGGRGLTGSARAPEGARCRGEEGPAAVGRVADRVASAPPRLGPAGPGQAGWRPTWATS